MARRLYETTFTVPAGTAIATPFSQAVILEDQNLDNVRIVIPDGHNGLTGFQITWGGVQVVPFGMGTFIVGNDEIVDFPYDGEVTANGLVAVGYNLDIFAHSWFLRWQISDMTTASPVIVDAATNSPAVVNGTFADIAGLTGAVSTQ